VLDFHGLFPVFSRLKINTLVCVIYVAKLSTSVYEFYSAITTLITPDSNRCSHGQVSVRCDHANR